MPTMDIKVSPDLQKLFELPSCVDIRLPKPEPLKLQLPTGGTIQAFADISKGIPTDCSMTFSMMLQIAPFLASIDCLFKVLGIIGPLTDVIKSLGPPPDPIKLPPAILKFLDAAEKLAPCLLVITGAPLIPFLKDLLCLIIKALNCFLGQLKTLLGVLTEISSQLNGALASGNTELITILQCAQANADLQAQHLTASIEPIGRILELAAPLMELAGQPPMKLPAVDTQTDIDSLNQLVKTIQTVVATLQIAADLLGGCGT
jgi:hypothetical protein